MDEDIPEFATVAELNAMTGTSKNSIYKHIEKAGLEPRGKEYKVEAVLSAIVEHRKGDNRIIGLDRAEKLKLECELLQIKIDEERGRLVPIGKVEGYLDKLFTAIKQHILVMPAKVSPMLAGEDTEEGIKLVLEGEAHDILTLIADYEIDDEAEDGEPGGSLPDPEITEQGEATEKANGNGVGE
jgi:hypothetical protein